MNVDLPADDFEAMATLCRVLYHQADFPTPNIWESYEDRKLITTKSQCFQEFIICCDKYQSTHVCANYISSWFCSYIQFSKDYETDSCVPFIVAECAVLLRDRKAYRDITKTILLRYIKGPSVSRREEQDFSQQYLLLEDTFLGMELCLYLYRRSNVPQIGLSRPRTIIATTQPEICEPCCDI